MFHGVLQMSSFVGWLTRLRRHSPNEFGSLPESGTTVPSSRRDPEVATVGEINGAAHADGQNQLISEQHETRGLRLSAATAAMAAASE